MRDFLTLLDEEKSVATGIVEAELPKGKYRVRVGSRRMTMRSAVNERLRPGQEVIINRTDTARCIVGLTGWSRRTVAKDALVVD